MNRFFVFPLLVICIGTLSWSWIPVARIGATVLEWPNLMTLVSIYALPFVIFVTKVRASTLLPIYALLAWSLLYVISMNTHATSEGLGIFRQQLFQAIFGLSLIFLIIKANIPVKKLGSIGLVSTLLALEISAIKAQVSLISDLVISISTGNRSAFVFGTLKKSFNAFINNASDVSYSSSQINSFSSFVVLFAMMSLITENPDERNSKGRKVLAYSSLVLVMLIFSTSAVLAVSIFALIVFCTSIGRPKNIWGYILAVVLVLIFLLCVPTIFEYAYSQLANDSNSRSARLDQYAIALQEIDQNILFGAGYFTVGPYPIHNWILFSWATSGILCLLAAVMCYVLSFINVRRAIISNPRNAAAIITILFIFVIRTMVGGAGGIPSGSALLSLVIVVVLGNKALVNKVGINSSDQRPAIKLLAT